MDPFAVIRLTHPGDIVLAPVPPEYEDIEISLVGRGTYTGGHHVAVGLILNDDTEAHYYWQSVEGQGATGLSATPIPLLARGGGGLVENDERRSVVGYVPADQSGVAVGFRGHMRIFLPCCNDPGDVKAFSSQGGCAWSHSLGEFVASFGTGHWNQAAAGPITRLRLVPDHGVFAAGTVAKFYGRR